MTPSFILVDTNVWHFALVKPKEQEFSEIHASAKEFLLNVLSNRDFRIAFSSYHVAELLEVLGKSGIDVETRIKLLQDFKTAKFYVKELLPETVEKALTHSFESRIHIYDYLTVYPLEGVVIQIFSADQHLQHPHFKKVAEVVNPLHPWILQEGVKPKKQKP